MNKFGFGRIFKINFNASKKVCAGILFIQVLDSIIPTVLILVLADFLDGVQALFGTNETFNMGILLTILLYLVLQLIVWIEPNISTLLKELLLIRVRNYFNSIIIKKHSRLKYMYIEDQEILELLNRVSEQPEERVVACYQSYLDILKFILRIAGIMVILIKHAWLSALVILVCAVPLFYLAVKSGRATYAAVREVTNYKRRANYLSEVLLARDYVYERSLFGYNDKLNKEWEEKFELARVIKLKTSIKWYIKNKMGSIFTAIIAIIATITLINPVLTKTMSVGLYISLVSSIYSLVKVMSWEFAHCVDSLANTHEYLKDLNAYFELEDEKHGDEGEKFTEELTFQSLEFRHVSFKYPNAKDYTINDLSLRIDAHKKYSIVGVNGAGKTTLIKLLLRLYDEYEGEILLNGKELRQYPIRQVREMFTVVFQDFAKYSLTIEDNIMVGALNLDEKVKKGKLSSVLQHVGLAEDIKKLTNGVSTRLGSNFKNGIDLSGGQWQRLAIARNLIGKSQITFFDEPTASLDPISESKFYRSIQWIGLEKTIVMISHRLAASQNTDCIYVLDGGRIREQGSFSELMNAKGLFSEMYEMQGSWYIETEEA